MQRSGSLLLLLLVLAIPAPLPAQTAPGTTTQRPTSTPYTGDLSIFETPGRDKRMQIERVMDLLGLKPGKSVADIGAGSGWFSVRAARRVAPAGVVYAEDINPDAVRYVERRSTREHLSNVRVIDGMPDDPKLPTQSVDAVMMLKAYHEIAHPLLLLQAMKPALRPDAKIGIVDRNGDGTDHGVDAAVVIREMQQAGFRLSSRYDFTKADGQDYFLIFTAQS